MQPAEVPSLLHLLIASCICASAAVARQPTDVVKVRLQAEGRLPAGATRRYNGAIDAYRKIIAQEGVLGLWTGSASSSARLAQTIPWARAGSVELFSLNFAWFSS